MAVQCRAVRIFRKMRRKERKAKGMDEAHEGTPGGAESPGDLPFGQGLSFATLDEYLAHLQRRGATGVPFYREVRPDLFELVAGRGRGIPAESATRTELMRRFGFTR
jgi:hypothetical protein